MTAACADRARQAGRWSTPEFIGCASRVRDQKGYGKMTSKAAGLAISASLILAGTSLAAPAATVTDASATVAAVKDICIPLLNGHPIAEVAKTAGLRNGRDGWVMPIDGKRRIQIDPPHGANPHICTAMVVHDPASGDDIVNALSAWAAVNAPPLPPVKVKEKVTGALYQLTTSTWYTRTDKADISVVYNEQKSLDGTSPQGKLDQGALSVEWTPLPS